MADSCPVFNSSQCIAGLPGRDGIDGQPGIPGLNGRDGAPGRDGVTCATNATTPGLVGLNGTDLLSEAAIKQLKEDILDDVLDLLCELDIDEAMCNRTASSGNTTTGVICAAGTQDAHLALLSSLLAISYLSYTSFFTICCTL